MVLETLNDYLSYHGISKKEACELFGKSEKTLYRWNENPPAWVLRIIQLMGKKPAFPDDWEGWYFDRDWLVDPAGNSYHLKDINALFWQRQFFRSTVGNQSDILTLKNHLEKQLKKQPVLEITLVESGSKEEIRSWSIAL